MEFSRKQIHHFPQQHHQLPLTKNSRQHRYNEWSFHDVPSDITVQVNGGTFTLHKFPLISRSGRIRRLVSDHRDNNISKMELSSLPGGPETFELAAKFCYGINFEITSSNVAQLCCVSEYLEMSEDISKDNLSSRAEEYLNTVVSKNLEMCVEVLQQCEKLLPLADELKIVSKCIDSIASKTCTEQMASSFSRLEYSSSGRLRMIRQVTKCDEDWWIEDLSVLRIDLFARVITAMKCRGVRPESISALLVNYAQKELIKSKLYVNGGSYAEEKLMIETIVSLLPIEKQVVPLHFLFGLLRTAAMVDCTIACKLDLERRIGSQLDSATLNDLLIPSFRNGSEDDDNTLFDVDTVHRILISFTQHEVVVSDEEIEDDSFYECESQHSPSQSSLLKVAKLVDSYLAEIATDVNLKCFKFLVIAEALPRHVRVSHDGLYRAVDVYLKAHQNLTDSDKKNLCKTIDFQKLSSEAGTHASQNDRLPLQSIVQILYFEQLKLRNSLYSSYTDPDEPKPFHQSCRINSGVFSAALSPPRDNYASLRRENRELKLELARLRMRLNDLEKDHVCMKMNMEKSNGNKFMGTFAKKMIKLNIFGMSYSRASSSPSRNLRRTDAKTMESV